MARVSSHPILACRIGRSAFPMAYLEYRMENLGGYLVTKDRLKALEGLTRRQDARRSIDTYQMQANQCAMSTNVDMSRTRTAAPYSEYLSILRATRTSLSNRAVFRSPMRVVVWKEIYICGELRFLRNLRKLFYGLLEAATNLLLKYWDTLAIISI